MAAVEKLISSSELIDTLHSTTLVEDSTILPYEHSTITIKEMDVEEIAPTTLYVVKKGLQFQRSLRQTLQSVGHDPLWLEGGLRLEHKGQRVGLIPPIVEDDPDHGPCLIDGAHRVYNGRKVGQATIRVIHILNVLPSTPIYAHPNTWDEIIEYDEIPSNPELKKRYRDNPRSLYRDFSSINGSVMREATS